MADVVNLRLARKRKAREERERHADENRARYGRTGTERRRDAAEEARLKRHLDEHRREDGGKE
jgi:hypothetical protein